LICADIVTRLLTTQNELRLGVVTSLIGAPFFFWLVLRLRKVAP
jgi:iron complex transport system permease protein